MKAFIQNLLNRAGFELVRASTLHRDMSDHLKQLITAKHIDAVIDVGANIGQYGQTLRRAGFTGHIYSFEPVSHVFKQLQETSAGDQKWHCFNLALGAENTKKTINVYEGHTCSSFLSANDYSKGIWASLNRPCPEEVSVRTLGDLFDTLPERAACRNFLLKMDTQGFDLEVFRGAVPCLQYVRALQSELALIPIYEGTGDPYAMLQEFQAAGFFVSGMYVINRDPSLAVIEYDVTLVRRPSSASP